MYSELPQNFIIFLQKKNRSIIVDFRTIFRFFTIFANLDFGARFWGPKFQIDQLLSVCPKKSWKKIFFFLLKTWVRTQKTTFPALEKCFEHCKWVILAFSDSCSGGQNGKNGYFCVFLMFFDDFARSQLLGSVSGGWRGAQKSKKIEIAKNQLKQPQSSVGWHIKGSKGRLRATKIVTKKWNDPNQRINIDISYIS